MKNIIFVCCIVIFSYSLGILTGASKINAYISFTVICGVIFVGNGILNKYKS